MAGIVLRAASKGRMLPYMQQGTPVIGDHLEIVGFSLEDAIKRSQDYLLSIQYPDGYWWAELGCNATFTAETVLLSKVIGTDKAWPMKKMEAYLRAEQRVHGGWELFYGDGGDLSVTVEAYMALRLLNVPKSDPALQKARLFVLEQGGITRSRVFTKLHLAMIGCYDWSGVPSIPPWLMLLPEWFPTTIYEMSSWARSITVPLIIVFDRKPVYLTDPQITLDELFLEGRHNAKFVSPLQGSFFVALDSAFKLFERCNLVPFRGRGLKAVEQWVLERQEASGDWGGYYPSMFYSILALIIRGYSVSDPVVQRGLQAVRNFSIETEDQCWVQASISVVWDTAFVVRSLVDSGLPLDHPALQRAGQWLLEKQILSKGDWQVKNKQGKPGGWAFEFHNNWFPDIDDTAAVVMALNAIRLPDEPMKQAAIARAVNWILTMQCKEGGWAAFDVDNNQAWLNSTPYGDLKAMIDPNTSDVTARALEMAGRLKTESLPFSPEATDRALAYLRKEQEPEGCWYGRWGVNYVYGTSGALVALSLIAPKTHEREISRGARWLVECQKTSKDGDDGGWGETCASYKDLSLKGQGEQSTASQTAWALMGLLAAGDALGEYETRSIKRGVDYLLKTQRADGTWHEAPFTGTGFPNHILLKYHLYPLYFSLIALGRYRRTLSKLTRGWGEEPK